MRKHPALFLGVRSYDWMVVNRGRTGRLKGADLWRKIAFSEAGLTDHEVNAR